MSICKEWVNFVTIPLNPEIIKSKEQRLDVKNAVFIDSEEYKQGQGDKNGFIVTLEQIIFDDDEFEAMEINHGGAVTIWTKKRVWTLHRDRGLEKLYFVTRHPGKANS